MKKILALVLLVLALAGCTAALAAGKLDTIAQRGTLLVGTTGDYKPMSYSSWVYNHPWFLPEACPVARWCPAYRPPVPQYSLPKQELTTLMLKSFSFP
jgi:hypothetical protein